MSLNERIQQINPSPTLTITARAKELRTQGIDILPFSAGEPDFDTPQNIKDAAIKAINEGFTKYTPVPGTKEMREAILTKLKRDYRLEYDITEVMASNGGKHSIFNILSVLIEPGDEVIIASPYWPTYPEVIKLVGGVPKVIETTIDTDFKITPDQLKKAITDKTKLFIFNSPSNPTGASYVKGELEGLIKVLNETSVYILSDDIYDQLIYDGGPFISILQLEPKLRSRTIIVNGVSKTYSMTGWRMGFTAAPEEITAAMSKFQGQTTSNICTITQAASIEALAGDQSAIPEFLERFRKRRDMICELLSSIPKVKCNVPGGAFYVFPDISGYLNGKTPTSIALAEYLLEEAKVALVPGSAFGAEGYLRLSYAVSREDIKEGLGRISKALAKL